MTLQHEEWICLTQAMDLTGATNLDKPSRRRGIRTRSARMAGRHRVLLNRADCEDLAQRCGASATQLVSRWVTTAEAITLTGRAPKTLQKWSIDGDLVRGVTLITGRTPTWAYQREELLQRSRRAEVKSLNPAVVMDELTFLESWNVSRVRAIERLATSYRVHVRTIERHLDESGMCEGVAA